MLKVDITRSEIYIRQGLYDKSYKTLQKSLTLLTDDNPDKDVALLNMARIHTHYQRYNHALKFLEVISEHSPYYSQALEDKIYILMNKKKYESARIIAAEYLIRYPFYKDSHKILLLTAYLDLKRGDYHQALQNISKGQKRLKKISSWINNQFDNRDTLTLMDLDAIKTMTLGEISQPPIIDIARKLFRKNEDILNNLSRIQRDVSETIYAAGVNKIQNIIPYEREKIDNQDKFLQEIYLIANDLIKKERLLYHENINQLDNVILTSSHKRRFALMKKIPRYIKNPWSKDIISISSMIKDVYDLKNNSAINRGIIHSIDFMSHNFDNVSPSKAITLKQKVSEVHKRLYRIHDILYSRQSMIIAHNSGTPILKNNILNFIENIDAEREVLKKYRDRFSIKRSRMIASEMQKVWSNFDDTILDLYQKIDQQESKIISKYRNRLALLGNIYKDFYDLKQLSLNTRTKIERTSGQQLKDIRNYYQNKISRKLSIYAKWQADILILKVEDKMKYLDKMKMKFDLEKEILRQSLIDMDQGYFNL